MHVTIATIAATAIWLAFLVFCLSAHIPVGFVLLAAPLIISAIVVLMLLVDYTLWGRRPRVRGNRFRAPGP